jgi:hypothetical protein
MDESYECIYYVKEQKTIEQWTCLLCNITEIKLKLGKHKFMEWEQYKLQCGHTVHPRCYRVWSYKQGTVGCSTCGLLPMTDENMNCYRCSTWGHKTNDCPILQFTYRHLYLVQKHYATFREEKRELE